jgi:hypothetical protein
MEMPYVTGMAYVTIIAMLALVQYSFFSFKVGQARGKFDVEAPATSGHETFDRVFRVHQNTLEQLITFVPGIYAFAYFVSPLWAAGIGVAFLIGRGIYARAYVADPASRSVGVLITFISAQVLVLGSIVGALLRVL